MNIPEIYYVCEPKAVRWITELETITTDTPIWDPVPYTGVKDALIGAGYTNVVDRSLSDVAPGSYTGTIITFPSTIDTVSFIYNALNTLAPGSRLCVFTRLQFLESVSRRKLFDEYPPKMVYISTGRLKVAKNGNWGPVKGSAVCYCWYVWEKGYTGTTHARWFN